MLNNTETQSTFRKSAIAAALALVTAPTMVQAQLEEVIVTAQKRDQSVQDVPSSIAAFSSEMLEKSNTRNFDELSNIASGVNITASGDGFSSVIRIRGVGNNAFTPAIRPSVGIFLDEIPLGSTEAAYSNMADIERVEILKGPQATLFGKEVSSGAISLFTRRPDTESTDGYVEANAGNLGLQELRVGGNLPLGDQFALRASAYTNDRDGTVDNVALGFDMGEKDADGYRVRLLWDATDTFSATLGYEEHNIEVYGDPSVAQEYGDIQQRWELFVEPTDPADTKLIPFDLEDRKSNNATTTARSTETKIWSLNMEWALSDLWTFNSVTGDQDYSLLTKGVKESNNSFTNSDGVDIPNSAGTGVGPYPSSNLIQISGTDTFTQEFRFTYEGDKWSSIVGAFYAETDLISDVHFAQVAAVVDPEHPFFGAIGTTTPYAAGNSTITDDTTEWAVFTHNIYSINEGLDLTWGLRYSEVEKEAVKGSLVGEWGLFKDLNHPLVPTAPWGDEIEQQKDSWDEITGTVKVTWWLNDEMSVYGGWDRGFKAGGHNVCKDQMGVQDCPEPFGSETADNFEVGLKGRFLENTLVLNASAYYQTYDDYQVSVQDEVGIGSSVRNAAAVEIQGVEMDFQWLTGEHLLIDGNMAYVDARWDDYENAGCLRPQYQAVACDENGFQDLSGKRLNYTSPWSANLNATWSDELANGISWYIRGEYNFRDDRIFFPDLDPAVTDGSYSIINASLGFSAEAANWDVILWGKNLLDENYVDAANRGRDNNNFPVIGGEQTEGYRMSAGLERTYGVTLKYRFGDY